MFPNNLRTDVIQSTTGKETNILISKGPNGKRHIKKVVWLSVCVTKTTHNVSPIRLL